MTVTACPACDSTQGTQVGGLATSFDDAEGERPFRQPAYAIRRCTVCRLYYKTDVLPLAELDTYYAQLRHETFERGDTFPTERYLHGWLARLPRGSRVLDFGCSTGRTLKGFSKQLTCFGVEVGAAAAAIARERGIQVVPEQDVRAGTLGEFDAIILSDVYEHLPRPVEVVAMLAGALKPGGWLAIVTGNADAVRREDRLGEFWYFRILGHLQMASEGHLTWLADRLGLRLESLHRCSHYATPLAMRLRQFAQSFAYDRFRADPRGLIATLLRAVPRLKRAEHWPTAPAKTYTKDHVVAILRRAAGDHG